MAKRDFRQIARQSLVVSFLVSLTVLVGFVGEQDAFANHNVLGVLAFRPGYVTTDPNPADTSISFTFGGNLSAATLDCAGAPELPQHFVIIPQNGSFATSAIAEFTSGPFNGMTVPLTYLQGYLGTDCSQASSGSHTSFDAAPNSFSTASLSNGTHSFTIRLTDNEGQVVSVSGSFEVQHPATPQPVQCNPQSQTVDVGEQATLHASQGTPPYSWLQGGSPATGSGTTFNTTFSSPGSKQIRLNDSGATTDFCTVNVNDPGGGSSPPIVNLKANGADGPISVPSGTSITLSWSNTNCTSPSCSCTALKVVGGNGTSWSGTKSPPNAGSQSIGNITSSGAYRLSCSSSENGDSDDVVINVSSSAIHGQCGPAERNYLSTETSWSLPFCNAGNASPLNPTFPSPGGSRIWSCQGINGGSNDSCLATRDGAPPPPSFIDIKFRGYDGSQIVTFAVEPNPYPSCTGKLRIAKNSTIYCVALVGPNDPNATKFRVRASNGIMALRRYP